MSFPALRPSGNLVLAFWFNGSRNELNRVTEYGKAFKR